jgi:endogenous inhibitor of DNA gyrase (YacG/DUF329 family)
MKCPNCASVMEREDTIEMVRPGWEIPSALYYCPECSSEYKWIKGQRLITIYDSYKGEYPLCP